MIGGLRAWQRSQVQFPSVEELHAADNSLDPNLHSIQEKHSLWEVFTDKELIATELIRYRWLDTGAVCSAR